LCKEGVVTLLEGLPAMPVIHLTAEEHHRGPQYDAIQWKMFVTQYVSLMMTVMAGCENGTLLWKRVQSLRRQFAGQQI